MNNVTDLETRQINAAADAGDKVSNAVNDLIMIIEQLDALVDEKDSDIAELTARITVLEAKDA